MPAQATRDQILDALGHQTRRDILDILMDGPRPVGEIAVHFPISRPAVSKHLKILHLAGLVTHHAHGTKNIFSLHAAGFQVLIPYLEQFWDQALSNFQQLADEPE